MKVICAFAIAFATAAVHAQRQPAETFVAVGCLARAVNDGSVAGSPGVPPAPPNIAPVLANSSEPTGAFTLTGATTPSPARGAETKVATATPIAPRTFVLDGESRQLEAHVGHRVEVTGRLVRPYGGAKAGDKEPTDHIHVTALKMLSAECPAAAKPH
jgi:hypothetical protein